MIALASKVKTYMEQCVEIGLETLKKRRQNQELLPTFKMLKGQDQRGNLQYVRKLGDGRIPDIW